MNKKSIFNLLYEQYVQHSKYYVHEWQMIANVPRSEVYTTDLSKWDVHIVFISFGKSFLLVVWIAFSLKQIDTNSGFFLELFFL